MLVPTPTTVHYNAPRTHGSGMQEQKFHQPKLATTNDLNSINNNAFPTALQDGAHIHYCYAAMLEPTGQIYLDQTGKFVAPSSTGNNYILILYDYDSNAIFAIPFKNCKSEAILNAYKIGDAQLCAAGLCPKLQCLANEVSHALQDQMTAEGINYQLVPPHLHCCNATERAIHTFKNTALLAFAAQTRTSPSISGINYFLRPN